MGDGINQFESQGDVSLRQLETSGFNPSIHCLQRLHFCQRHGKGSLAKDARELHYGKCMIHAFGDWSV